MAKRCLKKDLEKLENNIDDLIMLEDSARGTLCAIHKTIHLDDNFPLSQHQMIKLCPILKSCNTKQTRIPISRSRKKSRSNIPCNDGPIMCRVRSAHDPYRGNCCPRPHVYCRLERKKKTPTGSSTAEYINVEKTISCPEKMCYENFNAAPNKTCTITSRSSVQIDQFAQNLINTDEVVSELKGEIQKVKHQLHHLSQQTITEPLRNNKILCATKLPSSTRENLDESQITKLKDDNKRLRREIEAKRKLLVKSRNDVTKAKDILAEYEKKVGLLHVQALKSSKAMKMSKEKFCSCLKEKEENIRALQDSNDILKKVIKEKENLLNEKQTINETVGSFKKAFEESNEKCSLLTETNQNFVNSINELKAQLLHSSIKISGQNETIEILEKKILDLNCICKKIVSKTKKQKFDYATLMKSSEEGELRMAKEISELSTKLAEAEQQKICTDELKCRCQELQEKTQEYEKLSDKSKMLENECEKQHQQLVASNNSFEKDKKEMEKLIDELTMVVKTNKTTLLQMSQINQQQEEIIKMQNMTLLNKEDQLKVIEKESEEFKVKNKCLQQEVQELKKSLSGPCNKEACLSISNELDDIRNAFNLEKDTKLLKEKIIQDQSQTILNLQSQVKEKMCELTEAQNDTRFLEEEIGRINKKLIEKHQALDKEIDEKENLIEKLRILECQRNQLAEEINDFEVMLHQFKQTCGDNENQQTILRNLEDEITKQKHEWDMQRNRMAKEKQKAVCAAKFATQKLLDTVADFQRQVDAQKKVQLILTKMLHEKDEQLRIVNSKISNINSITKDVARIEGKDTSMKEIFFHNALSKDDQSEPNTNTSMYSSCSSCCKKPDCIFRNVPKYDNIYGFIGHNPHLVKQSSNLEEVIKVVKSCIEEVLQEVPSRDLT